MGGGKVLQFLFPYEWNVYLGTEKSGFLTSTFEDGDPVPKKFFMWIARNAQICTEVILPTTTQGESGVKYQKILFW